MKEKYLRFGYVSRERMNIPIYYMVDKKGIIKIDLDSIKEEFESVINEVCLNPHVYIKVEKNDLHKRPTIKSLEQGNIKPLSKKGSLSTIKGKSTFNDKKRGLK